MDGNGRWAKERGLPRVNGHSSGAHALRAVTETCCVLGVECLTVYAFSTENWKRPAEEVTALFGLLEHFLESELPTLQKNNVKLRAIGRLSELPRSTLHALEDTIQKTTANDGLTLILAINYSGRTELEDAIRAVCREVAQGTLTPEELTQAHLQKRLSNFLLWQLSYTELYVTPKRWPDFTGNDLLEAIKEFNQRQRRYGGL